ncbi:hypothetical protein Q3G72_014505 [Acer saccharum]|nr:hypothetical protein Q3G72_014505 [Acer saccharum]
MAGATRAMFNGGNFSQRFSAATSRPTPKRGQVKVAILLLCFIFSTNPGIISAKYKSGCPDHRHIKPVSPALNTSQISRPPNQRTC